MSWKALEEADKAHDVIRFGEALHQWQKEHPDMNLQDLERELRDRHMDTHLIAAKGNEREGLELLMLDQSYRAEYYCIISCRREPYALLELLQHSSSYAENFEKLALCGFYFGSQ